MRRYLLFALTVASLALFAGLAGRSSAQPAGPIPDVANLAGRPGEVSFLTGPNDGEPLDIVLAYLQQHAAELGLQPADLAGLVVTDQYRDASTGTSHIYLGQRYAGIELFNGLISAHVAADGAILALNSRFTPDLAGAANSTTASISPEQAAAAALTALGLTPDRPITLLEATGARDRRVLLSDAGVSAAAIPSRLVYYPAETGPRLAWELQIETPDGPHIWLLFVDAVSGSVLDQVDLVIHDDFGPAGHAPAAGSLAARLPALASPPNSYEVFAMPSEYPDDGPRIIVSNPAHPAASPWGWHDTDGAPGAEYTVTQGNNASAYQDQDANGTPDPGEQPDGGLDLDLTQDPLSYTNASITNLFYWTNIVHEVFYVHGFDEAAGNFQVNNYGRGGLGGDDVRAEGQDGSGTNGGNMAVLPDGQRPRMQMFIWTLTSPRRDGDLESSIIIHEYSHGISARLVGGRPT